METDHSQPTQCVILQFLQSESCSVALLGRTGNKMEICPDYLWPLVRLDTVASHHLVIDCQSHEGRSG